MNFYIREYELCFFLLVNLVMLLIYRIVFSVIIGYLRVRIAGFVFRVVVMVTLIRAILRLANVWLVFYVMLLLFLII